MALRALCDHGVVKTLHLFCVLSVASLLAMIAIDYVMGAKAEFINAWSVIERLLGRQPSAGSSAVFRALGGAGELACVVLANAGIGGVLTVIAKALVGK